MYIDWKVVQNISFNNAAPLHHFFTPWQHG